MALSFSQGRLNELISQIRLQSQVKKSSSNISYSLDDQAKHEAKQVRIFSFHLYVYNNRDALESCLIIFWYDSGRFAVVRW